MKRFCYFLFALLSILIVSGALLSARESSGEASRKKSRRELISSAVNDAAADLLGKDEVKALKNGTIVAIFESSKGGKTVSASLYNNDKSMALAYLNGQGYSEERARTYVERLNPVQVRDLASKYRSKVKINVDSEYAVEDVEYNLQNASFKLVDRHQIELLMAEQEFQMSGFVSDESAVSLGKALGANVVVTVSVDIADGYGRIMLKALSVQTAEIVGMGRGEILGKVK
jgi:hypothetical protein